nr:MAG TPA_asm: hypothetical protein [Bacteriophage sp.]
MGLCGLSNIIIKLSCYLDEYKPKVLCTRK